MFDHIVGLTLKGLRANHASYVTKTLRNEIMGRSNLQTKCFKTREHQSHGKNTENRKIIAVDYTKKNAKHSSTT